MRASRLSAVDDAVARVRLTMAAVALQQAEGYVEVVIQDLVFADPVERGHGGWFCGANKAKIFGAESLRGSLTSRFRGVEKSLYGLERVFKSLIFSELNFYKPF